MRFIAMLSTLALAMLVTAGNAQAVNFYFVVTSGSFDVGADVDAELWCDVETDDLQAWFLEVNHPGNSATAAAQEPFVFVGGALASALGTPTINSIDGGTATGQYAFTVNPPGFIPAGTAPFMYGTISFQNLVAGDIFIDIGPGGAVGGPVGLDLVAAGRVTFETITVPEPGMAVMGLVSLATLGVIRRRSAARR